MNGSPACPECGASGPLICGMDMDGYDGVLYWMCLPRGHRWHRFATGPLRKLAQDYMDGKR